MPPKRASSSTKRVPQKRISKPLPSASTRKPTLKPSSNARKPSSSIKGTAKKQRSQPVDQRETDTEGSSEVSLVDGLSSDSSDEDEDDDTSESQLSDQGPNSYGNHSSSGPLKRSKGPNQGQRLRRWRRLTLEERDCVTSQAGIVWKHARPILSSLRKDIRSYATESLLRSLSRTEARLESLLVPPLAKTPQNQLLVGGGSRDRQLPSSMLSWRLNDETESYFTDSNVNDDVSRSATTTTLAASDLVMAREVHELERSLLPEVEQIVELSRGLDDQLKEFEKVDTSVAKLSKELKALKAELGEDLSVDERASKDGGDDGLQGEDTILW
ncbi:hypothetical protein IE53DRAFT_409455 [Violaceomyces palustris]|uniref:Uncharacterized protein n=1 Tax=Violaceomyces palustris TaxID=1673888 RepID=A0ACD0P2T5_9BASI|nr:hypothetical protein IE53DRAFT_409455 [Violaceomyces palustris]